MANSLFTNSEVIEHKFKVGGMDCAGCARTIENAVGRLNGVDECSVNFTTETLRVNGSIEAAQITNLVQDLGYKIIDKPGEQQEAPRNFLLFLWQRLETQMALAAAILLLPGLVFTELLGQEQRWINGLSVVSLVLAGWPVARSAWSAVTVGKEININVLMTVAAVGAVIIGAYVEAAMVMVLFALGEALEGYTAGRARHAIRSLIEVTPSNAVRLERSDNHSRTVQKEVEIDLLAVGDVILVRPGERIPMDGRILKGASAVNQAAITGESRLIEKEISDTVFAGTINGEGALEIEVTRLAADNTISRMIRMVEEAQERRAPAQRFVDRFAAVYTPVVMVIALLTAVVPPLLFNQPFLNPDPETFGWLYRGLALLVVACPCALVISTPVAVISAISNAAQHGVLFKGGVYLERLSQIRAVALDKTGTITAGTPAVTTVRAAACQAESDELLDCPACEEVLALAGTVEAQSEHPLAHAVVDASITHQLDGRYAEAANVKALVGRGVVGEVDGREIVVGSHRWFDENIPHSAAECQAVAAAATQGYTSMMIGADEAYLGTITVADTIRPDSREVVTQLGAMGLQTVMLTGDEPGTAQEIGRQAGVSDIRASLLPEDKVSAVRELQENISLLAMVGDGINDAPALATADVGIAIGGAGGSAQAMETSDVTLMQADLSRLPFAIQLGRETMRTIRANVVFSIAVKLLFLVLVLIGWGTMWMAVLADMGTSVLVTLYGMRLLKYAPPAEM